MGMARLFLFIFCLIISNKAVGNVQGETLICDKDRRGYNFISKDKVEVLSINFYELNIISINHSFSDINKSFTAGLGSGVFGFSSNKSFNNCSKLFDGFSGSR